MLGTVLALDVTYAGNLLVFFPLDRKLPLTYQAVLEPRKRIVSLASSQHLSAKLYYIFPSFLR